MYISFNNLWYNWQNRNWSIITYITLITWFKNRCDLSFLPVIRKNWIVQRQITNMSEWCRHIRSSQFKQSNIEFIQTCWLVIVYFTNLIIHKIIRYIFKFKTLITQRCATSLHGHLRFTSWNCLLRSLPTEVKNWLNELAVSLPVVTLPWSFDFTMLVAIDFFLLGITFLSVFHILTVMHVILNWAFKIPLLKWKCLKVRNCTIQVFWQSKLSFPNKLSWSKAYRVHLRPKKKIK